MKLNIKKSISYFVSRLTDSFNCMNLLEELMRLEIMSNNKCFLISNALIQNCMNLVVLSRPQLILLHFYSHEYNSEERYGERTWTTVT